MDHNHGGPDDMEMLCPMQMSVRSGVRVVGNLRPEEFIEALFV